MNFRSDNIGFIGTMKGVVGSTNVLSAWNSGVTNLDGHTTFLPASLNATQTHIGDDALTEFPFFQSGNVRAWGIKGEGVRWTVDDPAVPSIGNGFGTNTIHRVFVR